MLPPSSSIAAARRGDAVAAEALFAALRAPLQRYLSGRLPMSVRTLWETDDLVQEVCSRALHGLPRFDNDSPVAFWGYLRTIARNISIDVCRSELTRRDRTVPYEAESHRDPSHEVDILAVLERQEAYEQALGLLDERSKSGLVLRLELDASYEDVAAELGYASAEAARKSLRRALDRVLGHLQRTVDGRGATDRTDASDP